MNTAATTTATRSTKGTKTIVTVTFPDGTVATLGGKRAERAAVVLVVRLSAADSAPGWGLLGLRADAAAGAREVATWQTKVRTCEYSEAVAIG